MDDVIVTGIAGFIGSHTTELLLKRGYRVIGIDNLYAGSLENIPRNQNVYFSKTDISVWNSLLRSLEKASKKGNVNSIIHLAAIVGIPEAANNPWRAIKTNVLGVLNVAELARKWDISKIVFASSAAVYGEPSVLPIKENHPVNPANLYGVTKLMGEMILNQYAKDYGIRVTILRYFNVYGPRMRKGSYAGVIHVFIEKILNNEPPIIYGDGHQTRDFVFVEDVARANVLAIEKEHIPTVINIGSGKETSVNELYKLICNIMKCRYDPIYKLSRPGDVRRSVADIQVAKEKLGWEPRYGLSEGLELTIKYYTKTG